MDFTEKRLAAQKAEADFFAMLKENSLPAGAPWKEVTKNQISVNNADELQGEKQDASGSSL